MTPRPAAAGVRSAVLTSSEVARVRDAVLARQAALGLPAEKILAPATWSRLMRADPMRASTFAKVDDVLRWKRGSCERIARGEGGPIPLDDSDRTLVIELSDGQRTATVDEVWLASARLTVEAPYLPPDVRAKAVALVNRLIDDYRQRHDS